MRASLPYVSIILALAFVGCEEDAPGPSPEEDRVAPPATRPAPLRCDPDAPFDPGPTQVRRLTRDEYDNTVRDLFGFDERVAADLFPPDEEMLGFDNNARALQVTPLHAEQYLRAAETLAQRVAADLECEGEEQACFEGWLRALAPRAWRRPVAEDELAPLLALWEAAADMEGPQRRTAAELAVEALLQSPSFMYLVEVGAPDPERPGVHLLTSHEVAVRLAYLLWRTMPDAALFEAAAADALSTPEQVAEQARRMLADPRAKAGLWRFFEQWLHLDEVSRIERDPDFYPEFRDRHRELLYAEARAFVEQAVWGGDLRDLFSSSKGFLNDDLAALYRLPGVGSDTLVPVDLDPDKRAGLLTLGAVLAVTSKPNMTSPVHRGIFVREQLFCTPLPPPPPDVVVTPPDPDPTLSTRDKFAEHSANPACVGCHQLVDPIGFGLEHYDAMGRWREFDGDGPVNAWGRVVATIDADGDFYGAAELAERVAQSEQVHRCVATQLFRYAFGRGDLRVDACTLDALYEQMVDAGHDFEGLVVGLVQSDAFRTRRADPDAPVGAGE